ncbi:MAG: class I mannose-6-phosphate isomerase [Acidobacteria bacterium]|nr:class I mannose-6-phosphate isomerase [Acidobacteriota bacterium]
MYPLRLTPSWREKIWGSTNLEPLFGRHDRQIGEAWYTFEENTVINGPWAGQTLAGLMERHGARLMGTAFRPSRLKRRSAGDASPSPRVSASPRSLYFPLLIKFLFTSERLSVQVHPDDAYALEHEDGPGKTEMWYVVRADPGAAIALGLTEPLDRDKLREAALSGEIVHYLNWVPVKAGDAIFSPPGTLHSIGPGLALCEVQQNSDLTYRFYDFGRLGEDGRLRPLHIDRAVEVTRLDRHPGVQPPGDTLATCDYFTVERLRWEGAALYRPDRARMHLLIFLEGRGELGGEPYQPGDVYLIPAALDPFELRPSQPSVALLAYVPGA